MPPRRRIAITLEQCWHTVPGGTATSALESIKALSRYTTIDMVGVSARHPAPPPAPWTPTIPVKALPLPRPALYEAWHRTRHPKVQRATGRVDAIHVTGMAMPPRSAPLIVTVHDLAFVHDPAHFTPRGVKFFHRAIELAATDADIVICPSQATIDDCVAYGFDRSRLRLVPWGIDAGRVEPGEVARVRAAYALDKPYVLWTGTIEPRKNLATLLDAFGRVGGHDVDLVLAGPKGWNDELEALESRAEDRVRRLGFIPSGDLGALYAGAEMFCFPSLAEGFGLPVLEAMAQGTPVVTSTGTATAEVVHGIDIGPDGTAAAAGGEPAGLLIDPRDPDALAAAIKGLLDEPERAARLGEAGAAVARTFTWERTAGLLEVAFEQAIDGRPAEVR